MKKKLGNPFLEMMLEKLLKEPINIFDEFKDVRQIQMVFTPEV